MANEVVLHETRTPSMIVGCDPGKSGALARLDHAGRLVVEPTLFEGEGAA